MEPSSPLIITGLAGAGMSSTLKILEDLGYEVFDNFPLPLVDQLVDGAGQQPVAIGIDTRTRAYDPDVILEKKHKYKAELVFMTCTLDKLQQRFTETRRRHPQAIDRPVHDGIFYEEQLLGPLRVHADFTVDTTDLNIHDLRRVIEARYRPKSGGGLSVTVMSFGFKNGVPREADIVMDVRFLKNPHWDPVLQPMNGHDPEVGAYIETDPAYAAFIARFQSLLEILIDGYGREGKHYLTIAIGCTGGRHRSVYVSETLLEWVRNVQWQARVQAQVLHRDLT